MIPKRGPYRGKSFLLYEDYNDVQVFVEDADFENLYLEILRSDKLRLRKVFSKNGKAEVVEAARGCSDPKCIYVIDRDWDDLLGGAPTDSNIVVLDKHSIENYLLDYSGFCRIVLAEHPRKKLDAILPVSAFERVVTEVAEALRPLFETFVAMLDTGHQGRSCSHRPGKFAQRNKSQAPDADRIREFIIDANVVIPEYVRDYFKTSPLVDCGHGKYMLHYVWQGVRHHAELPQLRSDTLMMRLAQGTDAVHFDGLRDAVADTLAARAGVQA